MILILSEDSDQSSNMVIDWLIHYKIPYKKVNREDITEIRSIYLSKRSHKNTFTVKLGKDTLSLSEISGIWFRRGFFTQTIPNLGSINYIGDQVESHLRNEYVVARDFIHYLLEMKPHIGSRLRENPNKLMVLFLASEEGLKIPETLITTSIKELKLFREVRGPLITKGIQQVSHFRDPNFIIGNYTESVDYSDINQRKHNFFVSLFQEELSKLIELRIFYLLGKCHTMAIFSQLDSRAKIDFRHYNYERPHRYVPFNLPDKIQMKLNSLMKKLKLNTGSIDMIYTPSKEYVFLEVNPVGQFGMVSWPCNFSLENKIALFLKSAYEEYQKNKANRRIGDHAKDTTDK